ncbi:SET [Glarea lozoyensis ATCC 20868]|uniref:SET n=1 Tax=Glarea lozoyensis (strain ATCC 20868 / MF5171) TaxID=1116229 RepID=S3CZT9_GLAL2|nr:SET [Glarea lozoyensis ATCC 20868]EPE30414.1 SET [Glarea lozoyensis ATCC 20868]
MAPLKPTWTQPSHPSIQTVIHGQNSSQEYTSKSVSKISLPPFALYAKMAFPPCTPASEATYATVQCGRDAHLNLNSDLVYINHSCEPSVIFETSTLSILAGPKGLKEGEELTFFYPSTEWEMAQGFDCLCGTGSCKGWIGGAKDMGWEGLKGMYLNGHIRELLEERDEERKGKMNGKTKAEEDSVVKMLGVSVEQAKKAFEAVEQALEAYKRNTSGKVSGIGSVRENGIGSRALIDEALLVVR